MNNFKYHEKSVHKIAITLNKIICVYVTTCDKQFYVLACKIHELAGDKLSALRKGTHQRENI